MAGGSGVAGVGDGGVGLMVAAGLFGCGLMFGSCLVVLCCLQLPATYRAFLSSIWRR